MQAAKTGAPWHPQLPCTTVGKARLSCEQAPARYTSMRTSTIQSGTAECLIRNSVRNASGQVLQEEHEAGSTKAAPKRPRGLTCVASGSSQTLV